MNEDRTCRKCRHHICKDRDKFNSNAEWICINEESHNYGDRTLSTERCPDFEARAEK